MFTPQSSEPGAHLTDKTTKTQQIGLVARMMLEHRLPEGERVLAGGVRDLVNEGFGRVGGV